jgi:hypothetical protein
MITLQSRMDGDSGGSSPEKSRGRARTRSKALAQALGLLVGEPIRAMRLRASSCTMESGIGVSAASRGEAKA